MAQVLSDKCPICGKAASDKARPFCSPRCAMLDLGQWLGEGYRVPTDENDDETEVFSGQMDESDKG